MSAGFLPDWQYSFHSVCECKPSLWTNARAFLKDRNVRNCAAPSQSSQPAQPAPAYIRFGVFGMSRGHWPDLRYSRHSLRDFNSRPRTNSRAFLKCRRPATRRLLLPSQSPQLDQPAPAYVLLGLAGISCGFLFDKQYCRHWGSDLRPRPRTKARAFSKDRNSRALSEIRPVPIQSPQLTQPDFAYTTCG
jgi:hypothetical protein